jgi:RNA polymerase sigma-70 factor (ECF subfamily)
MTDYASRPAGKVGSDVACVVVPVVLAIKHPEATLITLFETEESALLSFAVGLVRQRSVAEELVQEAFLRLHEVWDQVENPRGWLYRSVRNLALNHLRDHRHEIGLEGTPEAIAESRPDQDVGRMEAIGMVRLLLAGMEPEDQELIRLKYHEDLKYGEISRRTGLGVGNVGYKLHHLLKGLADALRHAGIEGSQG